jgi:tetratricopeptide (TPR) repeat protein
MPFYDFFQIQQLYKLDYEEFKKLLLNLATITNRDKSIFDSINDSRQKSLLELTGGSPRLTVILFEQIAKGFSSNIKDDLEKLADSITPFYKARFEELPPQQQIIIDTIALNWNAIPLNELSTTTRMQNNQLSPQLKRLVDDGWIETTPAYKAKGNAYFISERFFNIYYLIRNSSRRHKDKVYCLSRFLECFYGKEDLENISKTLLEQGINSSEEMRLFLALSSIETLEVRQREQIREKTFETFLTHEELRKDFNFSEDNYLSKGIFLFILKQYNDAINYFNGIIINNKSDKDAWLWKGNCLVDIRQYEDAIDCFNKVIELNKNNEYVWFFKGKCLYIMVQYTKAIDCFNKAIKLNKNNEYAWFWKGKCLYNIGQYMEAINFFNKSIDINKNNEIAWRWKGKCLSDMGQCEEAIDCFDMAIKLSKNDKNAYNCCNKLIELEQKNTNLLLNKDDALNKLQKYTDVVNPYERSIEADHEDLSSKFNLIFLYRDILGELNKAIELFISIEENKINKEENINFVCRYYLHKALFELHKKNNGLAREYLSQAFEILEKAGKILSIAIKKWYWWIRFGSVVIKLNCSSWLIAILEEKGYNIVLSPYYTAIKALEIEQKDSKKDAEIYLNNQAVEISNPAKIIVERMRKYL